MGTDEGSFVPSATYHLQGDGDDLDRFDPDTAARALPQPERRVAPRRPLRGDAVRPQVGIRVMVVLRRIAPRVDAHPSAGERRGRLRGQVRSRGFDVSDRGGALAQQRHRERGEGREAELEERELGVRRVLGVDLARGRFP